MKLNPASEVWFNEHKLLGLVPVIINDNGKCSTMSASLHVSEPQADWFSLKVCCHPALVLHSSYEWGELSQCHDDSIVNIIVYDYNYNYCPSQSLCFIAMYLAKPRVMAERVLRDCGCVHVRRCHILYPCIRFHSTVVRWISSTRCPQQGPGRVDGAEWCGYISWWCEARENCFRASWRWWYNRRFIDACWQLIQCQFY